MSIKIVELDWRFKGRKAFKYRVGLEDSMESSTPQLAKWLKWAAETWGMSVPLDMFLSNTEFERNPHWVWHHYDSVTWKRLYLLLKSDQDLALFKLKWM